MTAELLDAPSVRSRRLSGPCEPGRASAVRAVAVFPAPGVVPGSPASWGCAHAPAAITSSQDIPAIPTYGLA